MAIRLLMMENAMSLDSLRRRHQAKADAEEQAVNEAKRLAAEREAVRARFPEVLASATPIILGVFDAGRVALEALHREPVIEPNAVLSNEFSRSEDKITSLVALRFISFRGSTKEQCVTNRIICVETDKDEASLRVISPSDLHNERHQLYRSFGVEQLTSSSFATDLECALEEAIEALLKPETLPF